MALAARNRAKPLKGRSDPRIAPPRPLHHGLKGYREEAKFLGLDPMPWQNTAATYLTAKGPDDKWLYREVAIVVARQNGKTTLVKPLILQRLRSARRIMLISHVRELSRTMFETLADALEEADPSLFPKRRGKTLWARRQAGGESIVLTNGGSLRIAAAMTGSARGHSIDDLIIDELRELDSFEVINSAKPAQRFSANPQTIYLSNAGDNTAIVLDSVRKRAGEDPNLAYLEWSAEAAYAPDDRRGWVQANPAIGPDNPQVLIDLEHDYLASKLGGNMAGFETESLCRWVPTTRELLVDPLAWAACRADADVKPHAPTMAVSIEPEGRRASAALAWVEGQPGAEIVHLRLLFDVTGDPIDTARLALDIRDTAAEYGVRRVGYDPLTDAELVKTFKKPEPLSGQKFGNASQQFARLVNERRIRWLDVDPVSDDLTWTARKLDRETGSFEAVRAQDDRPVTAALAAIRAVWLASGLRLARPRVM